MLMQGKKGIIVGIANNRSLAFAIAKQIHDQGASFALTYFKRESNVRKIKDQFNCSKVYELNICDNNQINNLAANIAQDFGKIDFIVHSVAFAKKDSLSGAFIDINKADFMLSLESSTYSLIALTKALDPYLNDGASILTLGYLGSSRYTPNYNIMGVAKAALEASVKYMAIDLGGRNIRVNVLSSGPVKTLAASGIKDFATIMEWNKVNAPLRRNVSLEEVGKAGLYLLSDLSTGVTGEIHYVDAGFNKMAMYMPASKEDDEIKLAWDERN